MKNRAKPSNTTTDKSSSSTSKLGTDTTTTTTTRPTPSAASNSNATTTTTASNYFSPPTHQHPAVIVAAQTTRSSSSSHHNTTPPQSLPPLRQSSFRSPPADSKNSKQLRPVSGSTSYPPECRQSNHNYNYRLQTKAYEQHRRTDYYTADNILSPSSSSSSFSSSETRFQRRFQNDYVDKLQEFYQHPHENIRLPPSPVNRMPPDKYSITGNKTVRSENKLKTNKNKTNPRSEQPRKLVQFNFSNQDPHNQNSTQNPSKNFGPRPNVTIILTSPTGKVSSADETIYENTKLSSTRKQPTTNSTQPPVPRSSNNNNNNSREGSKPRPTEKNDSKETRSSSSPFFLTPKQKIPPPVPITIPVSPPPLPSQPPPPQPQSPHQYASLTTQTAGKSKNSDVDNNNNNTPSPLSSSSALLLSTDSEILKAVQEKLSEKKGFSPSSSSSSRHTATKNPHSVRKRQTNRAAARLLAVERAPKNVVVGAVKKMSLPCRIGCCYCVYASSLLGPVKVYLTTRGDKPTKGGPFLVGIKDGHGKPALPVSRKEDITGLVYDADNHSFYPPIKGRLQRPPLVPGPPVAAVATGNTTTTSTTSTASAATRMMKVTRGSHGGTTTLSKERSGGEGTKRRNEKLLKN